MKLNYFNQDAPDEDDELLFEAIAQQMVPSRCLLGGVMVSQILKEGETPCDWCACPKREVCGGSPQKSNFSTFKKEPDLGFVSSNSDASAKKVFRQQQIAALRNIVTGRS